MSWFASLRKKFNNHNSEQKLTDVVRGIQWAVNTANQLTANQFIGTLERFFEKEPDGTYKATEVKIKIDDDHYTSVPLLSLVTPNGLFLKNMEVDLAVKIDESDLKHVLKEDLQEETDITRSSFKVSFSAKRDKDCHRCDVVGLKMTFAASEDLPEGVSRIIEQLTHKIQPHKIIPNTADVLPSKEG